MLATVGRWGRSLAVRLPMQVAEEAGLSAGQKIELFAIEGEIIIRPTRRAIDVAALFAGRTAEEWRVLYRDSYDWGPEIGREIIEE